MLKELENPENNDLWYNRDITEEEIKDSLDHARADAAPAPDLVYNKTLKNVWCEAFAKIIFKMFNAIWSRIFHPDEWLVGTVTPIPKEKEENKSHPKANRPITNTAI